MAHLRPTSAVGILLIAVLGGGLWLVFAPPDASTKTLAQAEPAAAENVTITISITSPADDFSLKVTRRVPQGITALKAMQGTVAMEVKEYSGIGYFVTSLCGIEPPQGKFWSPAVDGKKSQVGIAAIKLDRDLRLDWIIKDVE